MNRANQSFDVLIVGGGAVGCAIARELARYRLSIALVEKEADVAAGTSGPWSTPASTTGPGA